MDAHYKKKRAPQEARLLEKDCLSSELGLFFLRKPFMRRCRVEVLRRVNTGHHGIQPNSKNRREVTNARTQSSIKCNSIACAAGYDTERQSTSCYHHRWPASRLSVRVLWLCALCLRTLWVLRTRVFLQRDFPWSWSMGELGLSSRLGQPSI